jgi:hypothetical protein
MVGFLLLHGEQLVLAFWAIAILVAVGLIAACIWIVKRLSSWGPRAGLASGLVLLAVAGTGATWWLLAGPNQGPPTIVQGDEFPQLLKPLPPTAAFDYSGVSFFQGKLFATTNIGLLEIDGSDVTRVFRVQRKYSVVSGPWVDSANQLLWILDDQTHELLSFDGQNWRRMKMPTPEKGYYSRGDALEGIRAVDDGESLWFHSGGSAWRWNSARQEWQAVPGPAQVLSVEAGQEPIGVLPLGDQALWILRHEGLSFLVKENEDYKSDTIVILAGEQRQVPNNTGLRFFVENWVAVDKRGYVCTRKGDLLEVTSDGISKLEAPGSCEKLARTTTGQLLASFRKEGVFQYERGEWRKRATHPNPTGTGDYWTYLAGDRERVAVAITPKPVIKPPASGVPPEVPEWTQNAKLGLWVFSGDQTRELRLPVQR